MAHKICQGQKLDYSICMLVCSSCVLAKERGEVKDAMQQLQNLIKHSQQETKFDLESPDYILR